jgi:hypothetical protein
MLLLAPTSAPHIHAFCFLRFVRAARGGDPYLKMENSVCSDDDETSFNSPTLPFPPPFPSTLRSAWRHPCSLQHRSWISHLLVVIKVVLLLEYNAYMLLYYYSENPSKGSTKNTRQKKRLSSRDAVQYHTRDTKRLCQTRCAFLSAQSSEKKKS